MSMILTTEGRYAECHYSEGRYAECHYTEDHYAECLRVKLGAQYGQAQL